jgi:glutamate dehydrogenase (NAD(P)+)
VLVGAVDVHGCVVDPNGLDVEHLLVHRSALGAIDRSSLPAGATERPIDEWLDVDADVLVPAALGDVLTEENAGRVRARVVVEAANIPTTDEAQRLLHERGIVVIPDYVANGGANAWWWWTLLGVIEADEAQSFKQVHDVMHQTVKGMLERADKQKISPRQAADELSMHNLDQLAATLGEDVPGGAHLKAVTAS